MAREMKDSGIPWIGYINSRYQIIRLKYVCKILDEFRTPITADKRQQDSEILYDYYGASGVIDKIDGYTIDDDVLLIGEDGANLLLRNLPLIYQVHGKAWINNHAHILKPMQMLDYFYAFYMLESLDITLYITGAAQPKFNQFALKNMHVILPPIAEQIKIANFLCSKCTEIDSISSDIQKEIEILEAYKDSIISVSTTRGLSGSELKPSGIRWCPQIPNNWSRVPSKTLFKLRQQKALSGDKQLTSSQKHGILYQDDFMRLENQQVVLVDKDFSILKHVEPGDFVISMRSFQGGLEYSELKGSISSAYVMLIPDRTKVYPPFYRWFFKSKKYINALQSTSNLVRDGQAMRFSNFAQIDLFDIPLYEQQEIAKYLDSKCSEIDSIISSKKQQLETLTAYKKSLIVTGKKEVPAV